MEADKNIVLTEPLIDELKYVDEDIRKDFEGKSYMHGVPTQIQLIKSINKLCELLTNFKIK